MNSITSRLLQIALFVGLFAFAPSAHAALVGHYTFDSSDMDWGAGSGQIQDISGSGNHGTAYNLSVSNEVNGQIGGALQFNGSNTYIRVPFAGSFPPSGNAPRTVCMWFKPTMASWTPSQAIFGYGSASGLNSFGIDMDNFPDIQFYTYGHDMLVGMGIAGHEEDWLQICWVWDGVNTSLLYSNGVLRGSQTFGSGINTAQTDVYIGTSIASDGFFPGIIDDVRIYDTAFTGEDIQELYGEGAINITNIASSTQATTATITWDTTAEADSTVWYGTSSSSYTMSTSSASFVTSHSLGLASLMPATTYYFIVVSKDDSGNAATSTEQAFMTLAPVPPVVTSFSPADNAVGASVNLDKLIITFNENVFPGAPSQDNRLVIKRTSDDATVYQMRSHETPVFFHGGVAEFDLVGAVFDPDTAYYVQFEHQAFRNASGGFHPGINDAATWNFATAPSSGGGSGGGNNGLNPGSRFSAGGLVYCTDAVTTFCAPRLAETLITPMAPSCTLALFPTQSIRLGARNDSAQVRLLEQYLNQFENANLPVDGAYSATDEAAVRAWQEKYASEILTPWGLASGTGYVFTTSLAKIRSIFLSQCAASPATTAPITMTASVRDLDVGMTGEDVRALQALLIGQGYSVPAGATGYFAGQTKSALAAYQAKNGIAPSIGHFGPVTRAHMKASGLAGLWW